MVSTVKLHEVMSRPDRVGSPESESSGPLPRPHKVKYSETGRKSREIGHGSGESGGEPGTGCRNPVESALKACWPNAASAAESAGRRRGVEIVLKSRRERRKDVDKPGTPERAAPPARAPAAGRSCPCPAPSAHRFWSAAASRALVLTAKRATTSLRDVGVGIRRLSLQ